MNSQDKEESFDHMANHGVKSLSLTDIVDIEVLQHLQDSFAQTFNMPSIIYGPKGSPITQPSCFTNFCTLVRSTKKGLERCETFDSELIRSLRENPEPTIRHGCALNNMVTGTVPIIIHDHHLANWGIGQMINRSLDLDEIREYSNTIGVDQEKLVEAARTLIPVEEETFKRVVSFLQVLSEQVSMLGFKNLEQARELAKRKQAEKALQRAHDELEVKVQKRTKDIVQVNETLHHEIQERKQTEKQLKINEEEMEKLILSLQKTLAEIKTLKGILPICSFCKKIRTDNGCWDKLEVYVMQHTDADFSHGVCPECYGKNYPKLDDS